MLEFYSKGYKTKYEDGLTIVEEGCFQDIKIGKFFEDLSSKIVEKINHYVKLNWHQVNCIVKDPDAYLVLKVEENGQEVEKKYEIPGDAILLIGEFTSLGDVIFDAQPEEVQQLGDVQIVE